MTTKNIWMVRAGRGGKHSDDFIENGLVAIGWNEIGALSDQPDKQEIESKLQDNWPEASPGTISMWASQLRRFYVELQVGDAVATYDPSQRLYFLGTIQSGVESRDHPLGRLRRVKWTHKVERDGLSSSTRNTLGAISTLFHITDEASQEMWSRAVPIESVTTSDTTVQQDVRDDPQEALLREDVVARSQEFIEDHIARLNWQEMQDLVAGILTAMGYRARVSPGGSDRGVDITASPDGLGLQEPRIFVEVKHRRGTQMGATEIRSFLGGRQPGDRCLYVSTGGFSKDARYEAERSSVPITLITLPDLRELLVEHYNNLDASTVALVPLQRLYWPVP